MANEVLPLIDGRAPSFAEVATTVDVIGGQSVDVSFKALSWESKIERGEQRGPGGRLRARTTGKKDDTASCTMYRSELKVLQRALVAVAPRDSAGRPQLSKVTFTLTVNYSFDDDTDITTVILRGCHFDKNAGKFDDGSTDADTVDMDLTPIEVVEVIDGQETVLL
jgi:hypothetical protein